MSVIHNDLLLSGDDGYNLTRSLRFRSSASAYLNRTPSSSPTDSKKYTYSTWIKKSKVATANQFIYGCGSSGSDETYFGFNSSDKFEYLEYTSGAYQVNVSTTAVYRDPSAWYHLVLVFDTTQATSSDRVKLYINGVQQTLSGTFPSLNYATSNVNSTDVQNINRLPTSGGLNFDGYYAETIMVDGQALTPSSFGQTSSTTGVWQPKKYTGTYGTNGFYLPFTDNSALTSGSNAGLGKDFSGNGNYWNTNNISITSGSTYDSMTDVPTLTSATASNFATLNPLDQANTTLSEANLKCVIGTTLNRSVCGTMAVFSSGKYYWEITPTSVTATHIGITRASAYAPTYANGVNYYQGGDKYVDGTASAYGATWTNNDVIGVALDLDGGTVTFYKNNTSQGAITLPSVSNGDGWKPFIFNGTGSASQTLVANFGQRPFAYTPPTGFVALNTFNLPTPTIGATASSQANKYFDAKLYTGTGSAQSITGLNFQPDFVWIKSRSNAGDHGLVDAVRGRSKVVYSDLTDAEGTSSATEDVTAFNSDGFSLGTSARFTSNNNGWTFASWNWKANGSGSSNTAGSITSTVSANTTSGFSVVTYTGGGTGGLTVGHGLGVAPKMIIVKSRTSTNVWSVYHASLGNTKYMLLNSTDASATSSGFWNNTTPSSTVFTVGTDFAVNQGSINYVAYCFSEVAGFSKFGSYTGNGSSDGPFIYTGFRPKFIMFKCTSALGHWIMFDSARNTYNVVNNALLPDSSIAENQSYGEYDFTSNGVKIRTTDIGTNGSGSTYIYMAFAENPFKYSLAR